MQRTRRVVLALVVATLPSGCLHVFVRPEVRSLTPPGHDSLTTVRVPLKVHMRDGGTVVFSGGATIGRGSIAGAGMAYGLMGVAGLPRDRVPLDSVVAVETFGSRIRVPETVVVSAAASLATTFAAVGLAKAMFGSCPTIYADTGAGMTLQAEGFSYSIAPAFERDDLDPLRLRPDAQGIVRLELRNEALETHYLNRVALVTVAHEPGTRVLPDQGGRPVAVRDLRPVERATDRRGRDVRALLRAADGSLFATSPAVVAAARAGDFDDWLDLEVSDLPPGDSLTVVLRLRNSLLNTVLLYQGMLGGRDALEWLEDDLRSTSTVLALGAWYRRTMGLRASVSGGSQAPVTLGDVGPIAYRDVAIVLPRPVRDARRAQVRLRFVADNWRIDHAAITGVHYRPAADTVPVTSVVVPTPLDGQGPREAPAATGALASTDSSYLETRAGQRLSLEFATSRPSPGHEVTYLLSWRGWYREWIRGDWLAAPARTTPFVPGDDAILDALRRWQAQRREFERAFYESRLPVR